MEILRVPKHSGNATVGRLTLYRALGSRVRANLKIEGSMSGFMENRDHGRSPRRKTGRSKELSSGAPACSLLKIASDMLDKGVLLVGIRTIRRQTIIGADVSALIPLLDAATIKP